MIKLDDYQKDAIERLKNGSILYANVGVGKSRTALGYFFIKECGGGIAEDGSYIPMKKPKDLYVITTAKKRDDKDWELEMAPFLIDSDRVTVDSWNNIKKYSNVYGAFFIFDEQRLVGSGAWVKAFYKIAKKNHWILLTATPGDAWKDYIPVFVANGFFHSKTEFERMHCVFKRFSKYPQIERYIGNSTLSKYRDSILVRMNNADDAKVRNHIYLECTYDRTLYLRITKDHWDVFENRPIKEISKQCYLMRRVVNSDISRLNQLMSLLEDHKRVIIFYNFNYELELLRKLMDQIEIEYSEWNGQKHESLPTGDRWCYLVQYTAGAEGWNCITTDTIIFYSQNYSYKVLAQSEGRIDRKNSPYENLYYYHLISRASIDRGISMALKCKKDFNEKSFLGLRASQKKQRI